MSNVAPPRRSRRRRGSPTAAWCLSLAAIAWLTSACASRPGSVPGGPGAGSAPPAGGMDSGRDRAWPEPTLPATVRVRVGTAGAARIVTLPLDEYVLGAVRAEMLPSTLRAQPANRALDVQAIVSRTYAIANLRRHAAEECDLCDTTHCQVYRPPAAGEGPGDPAAKAVSATRGQVLTFQGRVIQALFHADCGGHTASAASVWGGTDAPYLASVGDWYCKRQPASGWTYAAEEAAVIRALNADPRTRIGRRLGRVDIASRAPTGRALAIGLTGETHIVVRAEVFRAVLTQAFGMRALRSTWFDVARTGPRLRFSGVGFGHGVGLCQSGTLRRVEARQSPAEILAHYFPGSRLQTAWPTRARPDVAERLFGR